MGCIGDSVVWGQNLHGAWEYCEKDKRDYRYTHFFPNLRVIVSP